MIPERRGRAALSAPLAAVSLARGGLRAESSSRRPGRDQPAASSTTGTEPAPTTASLATAMRRWEAAAGKPPRSPMGAATGVRRLRGRGTPPPGGRLSRAAWHQYRWAAAIYHRPRAHRGLRRMIDDINTATHACVRFVLTRIGSTETLPGLPGPDVLTIYARGQGGPRRHDLAPGDQRPAVAAPPPPSPPCPPGAFRTGDLGLGGLVAGVRDHSRHAVHQKEAVVVFTTSFALRRAPRVRTPGGRPSAARRPRHPSQRRSSRRPGSTVGPMTTPKVVSIPIVSGLDLRAAAATRP